MGALKFDVEPENQRRHQSPFNIPSHLVISIADSNIVIVIVNKTIFWSYV